MQAIPARDLKTHDIVLVEAHIRRFVPSNANTGSNAWDSWRVKFDLVAVSVVSKNIVTNAEDCTAPTSETKEVIVI